MMTGKIEKAEMLAMLVRAEECAEKADSLYKQMYNFIWEEHERGKSDIAEEDWNGIVRSLEEQAYSYMEKALGDILEIMQADPGKELWMRLRYDVYDKMNMGSGNLRNMDFYQSGYMEGVTGAAAPINMYLAITFNQINAMDSARHRLMEIICGLKGIEYTQNKVYVEGIPLGISYKDFSRRLLGMGFKKEVEQKGETKGKEAFFTGRIRNIPVNVCVRYSSNTATVYNVDVIFREFIDQKEAEEEAARILGWALADYKYRNPLQFSLPGNDFLEMLGGSKHVTKYLCYPSSGLEYGLCELDSDIGSGNYFGKIALTISRNSLGHEYVIALKYVDFNASKKATKEEKK